MSETYNTMMNPANDKMLTDGLEAAAQALEKADLQELHALYVKLEKDYRQLLKAFDVVVDHYAKRTDAPRHQSHETVEAMRDVALAAIQLATNAMPKP